MAQIFGNLFFGLTLIVACSAIVAMLRGEWARIVSILSGEQVRAANDAMAPARIRVRSWSRPEPRRPIQPQHVAAA